MAWTLLGSDQATDAGGGGSVTVDTTGADFLILFQSGQTGSGFNTPTENKSNTFQLLNQYDVAAFGGRIRGYWLGPGSTFGTGHQFTNAATQASIVLAWFSGAHASPFDQQTSGANSGGGSTVQPGSITPGGADYLFVLGGFGAASAMSLDSSFSTLEDVAWVSGQNYSCHLGYKIKTGGSATAEDPTATASGGVPTNFGVLMATFAPAAGGGGGGGNSWYHYAQQREKVRVSRRWERRGLIWTPSYAARVAA